MCAPYFEKLNEFTLLVLVLVLVLTLLGKGADFISIYFTMAGLTKYFIKVLCIWIWMLYLSSRREAYFDLPASIIILFNTSSILEYCNGKKGITSVKVCNSRKKCQWWFLHSSYIGNDQKLRCLSLYIRHQATGKTCMWSEVILHVHHHIILNLVVKLLVISYSCSTPWRRWHLCCARIPPKISFAPRRSDVTMNTKLPRSRWILTTTSSFSLVLVALSVDRLKRDPNPNPNPCSLFAKVFFFLKEAVDFPKTMTTH